MFVVQPATIPRLSDVASRRISLLAGAHETNFVLDVIRNIGLFRVRPRFREQQLTNFGFRGNGDN